MAASSPELTVLVVDNSKSQRAMLLSALRDYLDALRVLEARDGREALGLLEQQRVDVVVTSVQTADVDGLELTRWVRLCFPDVVVVVMSADAGVEEAAIDAGADAFIAKSSAMFDELRRRLDGARVLAGGTSASSRPTPGPWWLDGLALEG